MINTNIIRSQRDSQQILSDKVKIAKWYLEGKTHNEIAEKLGLSRQTVGYELKAIFEEWKKDRIQTFEEKILIELEKINKIESEAWEEWFNSKKDKTTISNSYNTKFGETNSETTSNSTGNRGYIQDIKWCIETRLKILSILPKKNDVKVYENNDDLDLIDEATISLDDNDR